MRDHAPKSSVGATERQRQAKEWAYRHQASIPQRKQKHKGMHNSVHNSVLNSVHNSMHDNIHYSMHKNTTNSTLDAAKDSDRGPNWLKIGAAERAPE